MMMSFLRRISLRRLVLLCAATVGVGIAGTAVAVAVDTGPTPAPKSLANAVHAALAAPAPSGISAHVELVNHLFEGSEIASQASQNGPQGSSSPLLSGGSGRLWASNGQLRLELESQSGATQILFDKGTLTVYEPSSETLYRYTPPAEGKEGEAGREGGVPSVAAIQKELARLAGKLDISGATPTDVAGQAAYAATAAPKRNSGLFGDAELAWDAGNGVPLRFAVYAKGNPVPAIELSVSEISFGPVSSSTFSLSLPSGLKETKIEPANGHQSGSGKPSVETTGLQAVQAAVPFELQAPGSIAGMQRHEVRLIAVNGHDAALIGYGEGLGGIAVIETQAGKREAGEEASGSGGISLPTRTINGAKASELPTELGTVLTFDSGGVRHILLGSVTASTIESAARGL
ncbi:MAG: hypothetical protein ACYCSI_02520 [Solirubrobacteraceae bacterium]